MSKLAFSGNENGSGIFTIAAPNSDTDRTLTLPDHAGTILASATIVVDETNGRLGIGTSNSPSNKNTVTPTLNVSGSGVAGSAQITRHTSVGAGGALLHLSATRGSDVNSYTVLQSGDGIGSLVFQGADGGEFVVGAEIKAAVDGTPGDDDMPARLTFSTTADGASSATERMRIDSSGNVGIGTSSPTSLMHLSSSSGDTILTLEADSDNNTEWDNPQIHFLTDGGLRTAAITGGNATNENSPFNYNALNLQSQTIRFHTASSQDFDLTTERMRIDSSGVITIPNQPSIHLDGNSNTRYNTSGVNITQFSVSHSYGGMSFNSSNGRVTVPTAGRYLVCWNFYTYFDNTGELRIQLQVNGTGRMHSHKETQSNQSAYSGLWDDNLSGSTVINLAANDAIGFYVVNVTTGGGYYMGSQHSYWSAHLLG